ncbi:ParA family protein [Halomarina salina]|uniref:ParA family protein n=1 Tax=Halomarina salina TaxID=1872699 RepID=A0ABD5RMH3_9EURY|nr:ParA family protein [Halomarina salina]
MGSLSLVGAVGGAGTTRLTLECGAVLARAGREVAVLDAAYATQGLLDSLLGRVDTDVTDLCTDDDGTGAPPLAAGLHDLSVESGRLAVCPARAPFERLARAKTPEAAQRFASLVETAAASFDHVLVDAPPVAANQAVAAVTTTERVALVAPDTPRGHDGVARQRDRLADVGAPDPETVLTFAADPSSAVESSDVVAAIPEHEVTVPGDVPVCSEGDDQFVVHVAEACESLLDESLGYEAEEEGVFDRLGIGN